MRQNIRAKCLRCSRPLDDFDGRIGKCSLHKWVSPTGLGFDAEAAERNRQKAAAKEQFRLEQLRQEEETKAQKLREQHQSAIRKVITVVVALAVIAAAVVFFIVRPSINYENATKQFVAGEYRSAREIYSALGSHKDSAARVMLCDAMIDLQEGRSEDVAAKLDQLISEGQGDFAKQLADALIPVMADWKSKSLTPQAFLLLLGQADKIDSDGILDIAKLKEEGHVALLDGTQLSVYTGDINNDGNLELIVLYPDYSVTVYHMPADSNVRMAVDNDTVAACAKAFGNKYKDTDIDVAVACFAEAYRLLPIDDTRSALTAAYQLRSASHENAGDMDSAINDARSAMETSGTADAFTFFYDINLRNCKNGHDYEDAILLWHDFAANSVAELTKYSAKNRWQADAAQLHTARAAELAALKDEGCIDELRTAAEIGVDVTGAIAEAESYFNPGLSLARLRLMEIDLHGTDVTKKQQIFSNMVSEVRIAISEWKIRGITPADIPALIHFADDHGVDLIGINRDAIYEEAAVTSAGNISQHIFIDWNTDGYKELLTLDASGKLSLFATDKIWKVVSSIDTKLTGSSYIIADETAPLILILSSGKDELLAVTGTSSKLRSLFRETGISRYQIEGSTITFSRLLDGSIVRYNNFPYEAIGTTNRPVLTGIEWQQNDYHPKPSSAQEVIQRYFEARYYDISEEISVLGGTDENESFFRYQFLEQLPLPVKVNDISIVPYHISSDQAMFEVSYAAKDRAMRTYIKVAYQGAWKVIGAADSFAEGLSTTEIDFSVPILCTGLETSGSMEKHNEIHMYRLMLSTLGRLSFQWEASEKNIKDAYGVTLRKSQEDREPLEDYLVSLNVVKQKRLPIILPAGIYYLTVKANSKNLLPYHFTATMESDAFVELERNDTPITATSIQLNTAFAGQLLTKNDVDYYVFTLEQNSIVNVRMTTKGNNSRSDHFQYAALNHLGSTKLAEISVSGNVLLSETDRLYLAKGKYLLRMQKSLSHTDAEYQLTVFAEPALHTEVEYNNTMETATQLSLNQNIQGSFGIEGDVDYYVFTLNENAVIQPRFTFNPFDNNSKAYEFSVLNTLKEVLIKEMFRGKETSKTVRPLALPAGTYYIKLDNPQFVRQGYTLHVNSKTVPLVEMEPNSTSALATPLVASEQRTGVLADPTDVDYYRFVVNEQRTITLRLSFPQASTDSTIFTFTIEQNGKEWVPEKIRDDSGIYEKQWPCAPGEFFVKLESADQWYSIPYSLLIQ